MLDYDPIEGLIQQQTKKWVESPISQRLTAVESDAINAGRAEPWNGPTVVDFWHEAIREIMQVVRDNPQFLKTQAEFQQEIQTFLDAEQALIDEADELTEQIASYKLGALDPRYHRDQKRLHEVVKKFNLTRDDYSFNWDALPKPPPYEPKG